MEKEYLPISCVFYDFIEHFAVKREVITIVVKTGQDTKTYKTRILNTEVKNRIEYILLETPAVKFRMDQIISLNDKLLADYQNC